MFVYLNDILINKIKNSYNNGTLTNLYRLRFYSTNENKFKNVIIYSDKKTFHYIFFTNCSELNYILSDRIHNYHELENRYLFDDYWIDDIHIIQIFKNKIIYSVSDELCISVKNEEGDIYEELLASYNMDIVNKIV